MVKTKVVIAEDHKIISDTYKLLLESEGISVVGVVNDGVELIEWLKHNDVDVILLDIEMPKMDGISVAKYFVTNNMNYKVLIVSSHYSDSFVEACKAELNIKGFITKDYCHLELTKAVTELFKGNTYFSKMPILENTETVFIKRKMIEYKLSEAEKNVLPFLTEYSYKEIANKEEVSVGTIKTLFHRIRSKLGLNSNIELGKLLGNIDKL